MGTGSDGRRGGPDEQPEQAGPPPGDDEPGGLSDFLLAVAGMLALEVAAQERRGACPGG